MGGIRGKWKMEDGRRETEDGRQETGDGRQETDKEMRKGKMGRGEDEKLELSSACNCFIHSVIAKNEAIPSKE